MVMGRSLRSYLYVLVWLTTIRAKVSLLSVPDPYTPSMSTIELVNRRIQAYPRNGSSSSRNYSLKPTNNGVRIPTNVPVTLGINGTNLMNLEEVILTTQTGRPGGFCNLTSRNVVANHITPHISLKRMDRIEVAVMIPDKVLNLGKNLYLCAKERKRTRVPRNAVNASSPNWVHQGESLKVKPFRSTGAPTEVIASSVLGIRGEGNRVELTDDGVTLIEANVPTLLRIFGMNFSRYTILAFTTAMRPRGGSCDELPTVLVHHVPQDEIVSEHVLEINVELPLLNNDDDFYYICVKEPHNYGEESRWVHQGDDRWMRVKTHGRLLPLWLQIIVITLLLTLSGLFSGLNLGLMSLDKTELQVIASSGTETEKKYAQAIAPLRHQGNYLLCSLLLGNVLVNSTLTVLLDDLTSGIVAIIVSTMSIVIFGEIIPQAVCSRHGLAVGARTILITKFFMFLTFPLSYPISKLLDIVLGEEIGNVYDRERLIEFIKLTKDYSQLENEEMNIISGALELKRKTVAEVMTKIEDVYMIPYDAILDFETMSEIMKQGYTRIPVYDNDRNNIVAILHAKDLAFVDPDDNTPLKTLCAFYNHPVNFVFEDQTLHVMLNEFKKGKSHLAFVRRITFQSETDPKYEVTGVVTLEDIIEEIIQAEIIDETDVLTDNRRKQRRKEALKQDFSDFAKIGGGQGKNTVSPQLVLATYQYLSTTIAPFRKKLISETVLKRLMTQNIFFSLRVRKDEESPPPPAIYAAGQPADYFILILEGRVRVTVGKERLEFESGPFTSFGIQALLLDTPGEFIRSDSWNQNEMPCLGGTVETIGTKAAFIPDYTVVAATDIVYVKISSAVYFSAYRASQMERQNQEETMSNDFTVGIQKDQSDKPFLGNGAIVTPESPINVNSSARSPFPHVTSYSSLSQASVNLDVNTPPNLTGRNESFQYGHEENDQNIPPSYADSRIPDNVSENERIRTYSSSPEEISISELNANDQNKSDSQSNWR